jgi:methyltransferase
VTVVRIVLLLVVLQRAIELVYARRNTLALLKRGAIEAGRQHYVFFILLHASWLLAMAIWIPPFAAVSWWLLGVFALLQIARVWVVVSLGPYWTTRVLTLPGAPLVRRGPYRYVRHPNYIVVAAEIAVLPLAFGAVAIAIVFSVLNACLMLVRIRIENATLASRVRAASVVAVEAVADSSNAGNPQRGGDFA